MEYTAERLLKIASRHLDDAIYEGVPNETMLMKAEDAMVWLKDAIETVKAELKGN